MSMLGRYQKNGGFLQLVELIETCDIVKQERFLRIIENENLLWAKAIKEKMLTPERIFSWDDKVLAKIAPHLQEKVVAVIYKDNRERGERLIKDLASKQKERVKNFYGGKQPPTEREVDAHYKRMMETIRHILNEGHLFYDEFAPELLIEKNIEQLLASDSYEFSEEYDADQYAPNSSSQSHQDDEDDDDGGINIIHTGLSKPSAEAVKKAESQPVSKIPSAPSAPTAPKATKPVSDNVTSLEVQKMVQQLQLVKKENEKLKVEIKGLKDRLAAIRKIA